MDPAAITAVAIFGLAMVTVAALRRHGQRRQESADQEWQIAAAKLGLQYRRQLRTRSMEGNTEGFYVRVTTQPDPDQAPGQLLNTFVVALKGQLPRFTVVRTTSFMNPHDSRLDTGDAEFDGKLAIIRPVRSQSSGYFTDERRRTILSVFEQHRSVALSSSKLEVGITRSSVRAEDLVAQTRWLVRTARALSIETDRRGAPLS